MDLEGPPSTPHLGPLTGKEVPSAPPHLGPWEAPTQLGQLKRMFGPHLPARAVREYSTWIWLREFARQSAVRPACPMLLALGG